MSNIPGWVDLDIERVASRARLAEAATMLPPVSRPEKRPNVPTEMMVWSQAASRAMSCTWFTLSVKTGGQQPTVSHHGNGLAAHRAAN